MLNIGPQELLLILLVALLVVGPKRLPELSRTIGKGLREFRKAQDEVTKTIRLGLDDAEPATRKGPTTPPAAAQESGASQGTASPPKDESSEDESADIARSLGRGLSEIRRARREVQRTFRVDLTGRSRGSTARRRPSPGGASAATPRPSAPEPAPREAAPTESAPAAGTPPVEPEQPARPTEVEPSDSEPSGPVDPTTPA